MRRRRGTGGAVIRVSIVGLGAIGQEVLKAVQARPGLQLVSVVDPAFVGRDAGEVAGVGACGVTVVGGALEGFAGELEVALVLTGSSVADVEPIIEAASARGVDVISTCEDLAYADLSTPQLARRIDTRAREGGITVVGTGVNPGFVMDRLPLTLAAACVRVDHVHVTRIVDAAKRRAPLRAKVGAGLTVEEFHAGVAARTLGHRGFGESCALVGLGLGLTLDDIRRRSIRWSPIGPASRRGAWRVFGSRLSGCAAGARSSASISRCRSRRPSRATRSSSREIRRSTS